jgi:cytochrome P450
MEAAQELHGIAEEIAALRRTEPAEDLFTNLVQAEVDGEHLTDHQIGSFFVLIRFASPVMTFRRTAEEDTALGGRRILAGDKVVMFYSSRNYDDEVFDDPNRFDLSHSPNPHVGFGSGGRRKCLGNQLAKSMLRAILRELLTRVPDIHTVGEPKLLGTNFIRGVKSLDAEFTTEQ